MMRSSDDRVGGGDGDGNDDRQPVVANASSKAWRVGQTALDCS